MNSIHLLAKSAMIIAHRGASAAAPENTLAAFREAWEEGADGIELDVWLTKDGRIAVIHDETTKRTTGVNLVVKDHAIESLRKLDAGIWKGRKWKNESVPTLDETLAALPDGKKIFIEIKCGPEILPELARVIAASGKPLDQLHVIDFNFETLLKAKALVRGVKLFWGVDGRRKTFPWRTTYPDLTGLAVKAGGAGFSGLNLYEGFPLDAAAVSQIRAKGLALAVWTVNDPRNARRLAAAGADVIITDRPALIRAALEK